MHRNAVPVQAGRCRHLTMTLNLILGNHLLRNLFLLGRRPIAVLLIGLSVIGLLASLWPSANGTNSLAAQRPLALFLLGLGALMMWFETRRVVRPPRGFELSTFKHSTLAEDMLGPDTHPVGPPDSAFADFVESASTPVAAPANQAPPRVAPKRPTRWRAGVFRSIEWQRFEAVCAALFRQDGYITKLHSHGTSGGVEIWLHSPLDLKQPVRIVLCKHLSDAPVGIDTVREFQHVLLNAKVPSGAFVTAGSFTDEAKQYARRNHISPVDSANLLTVILRRSESQQQELLAVATQGEYWRPTCAGCNAKMIEANPSDEDGSWVCPITPPCPTRLKWVAEAT
jgi:restriction system protein